MLTQVRLVNGSDQMFIRPNDSIGLSDYDWGFPDVRSVANDRTDMDGQDDTTEFIGASAVSMTLTLWTGTRAILDGLGKYCTPDQRPYLYVMDDEWATERRIRLRADKLSRPVQRKTGAKREVQLSWAAPDGVWEDVNEMSTWITATIPATSGLQTPVIGGDSALNGNPYMETNVTGWTAGGGATLSQSAVQAHQGTKSLLITPNGSTAQPRAEAAVVAVTGGASYKASAWVFSPTGYGDVSVSVNWYDSLGGYISTSFNSAVIAANTWTFLSNTFTAPANAAQAGLVPTEGGTPLATNLLYVDEAVIYPASLGAQYVAKLSNSNSTGAVNVLNAGNFRSGYRVLLYGPCTAPALWNDLTGKVIAFKSGMVLGAGEYLDIDPVNRTVFLNSDPSVSRLNQVDYTVTDWWRLLPGLNYVRYQPLAATVGSAAYMTTRTKWAV